MLIFIETKDLLDKDGNLYPWGKFHTKEDLDLDYNLNGFLSDYSEGGYPLFFGIETMSLENVTKRLDHFDKFLDFNTLAANFVLGGYILDIGKPIILNIY
jgi:hypothetical protein